MIVPDVGSIKPHKIDIKVVFPAPFGPKIPTFSPCFIWKVTLLKLSVKAVLYRLLIELSSICDKDEFNILNSVLQVV